MPAVPSESLIALLAELRLATAGQTQSVAPRVRRLAHDLPGFDSVWVDALAEARVLTPFQAAEINSGRGAELAVGPYVLTGRLAGPAYGRSFAAVELNTRAPARLLIVDRAQGSAEFVAASLARLVEQSRYLEHPAFGPALDAGISGSRVWAACRPDRGVLAARWLVENGRLPAPAVLEIARQMTAALAELERIELVHGDLSTWGLTFDAQGAIELPLPGLRPLVRRDEGYAFGDLQPEGFDTLAPERIENGAAAAHKRTSMPADVCGGTWPRVGRLLPAGHRSRSSRRCIAQKRPTSHS